MRAAHAKSTSTHALDVGTQSTLAGASDLCAQPALCTCCKRSATCSRTKTTMGRSGALLDTHSLSPSTLSVTVNGGKDKAARTGGPHFHLCACQVQWQKRRLQLWVFVQVHGMLVAGLAVMELQGTRSSMHCHWQAFTRSVSAGSTCSACTTACMPLTCHSTQIPGMHAELDLRKAKL